MVTIIAGTYRSRRLRTLGDDEASRPYLSRVKESVFGIVQDWMDGARVLDLFAGVGTIGLEAVSRGASEVLMVEKSPRVYRLLRQNIEGLGCADRAKAMLGDALGRTCLLRAPQPLDLVFLDPPYAMMADETARTRVLDQIGRCREIMDESGLVVLRSPLGPEIVAVPSGFDETDARRYRRDMWVLFWGIRTG